VIGQQPATKGLIEQMHCSGECSSWPKTPSATLPTNQHCQFPIRNRVCASVLGVRSHDRAHRSPTEFCSVMVVFEEPLLYHDGTPSFMEIADSKQLLAHKSVRTSATSEVQ